MATRTRWRGRSRRKTPSVSRSPTPGFVANRGKRSLTMEFPRFSSPPYRRHRGTEYFTRLCVSSRCYDQGEKFLRFEPARRGCQPRFRTSSSGCFLDYVIAWREILRSAKFCRR